MKLNLREKVLLTLLGTLVTISLFYQSLLQPKLMEIKTLEEKFRANETEIGQLKTYSQPDNKLEKEFKIINAKVAARTEMYFPEDTQEKVIIAVDQLLAEAGLEGLSLVFSRPELKQVEENSVQHPEEYDLLGLVKRYVDSAEILSANTNNGKTPNSSSAQSKSPEDVIRRMDLTVQYRGSYENLLRFLSGVENYQKRITATNINMTMNSQGKGLAGSMLLQLYMLPKFPGHDQAYLAWDITGVYGKDDPFVPYSGYREDTLAAAPAGSPDHEGFDFVMTVKPLTADLPAIVLGKTGDLARSSYVYSDNAAFENAEISVIKKDNGYYYKYKTQYESYPRAENGLVPFQPSTESIDLVIYANHRNSDKDQNGVNLSIVNETDLPFVIQVINDDTARPRVNILKKMGNVLIKS